MCQGLCSRQLPSLPIEHGPVPDASLRVQDYVLYFSFLFIAPLSPDSSNQIWTHFFSFEQHVQPPTFNGNGEEQASNENAMSSVRDIPLAPPRQPPASALPQISRGSSTRSIYPSSSSLPPPSNPSSLPMWTRQQSRGSSTLHSHSHSTHPSQPRLAPPSAENGVHTGPYTPTLPPQPREKERESSLPQFTRPARGRHPPSLPSLREEYRYCRRCEIVKPPRTHHCRACGKVRRGFFWLCEGE